MFIDIFYILSIKLFNSCSVNLPSLIIKDDCFQTRLIKILIIIFIKIPVQKSSTFIIALFQTTYN